LKVVWRDFQITILAQYSINQILLIGNVTTAVDYSLICFAILVLQSERDMPYNIEYRFLMTIYR